MTVPKRNSDRHCKQSEKEQTKYDIGAYESEYQKSTPKGRMKKRRSGAWMKAMSRGRLKVGSWYMMSTMLAYKRIRTRMPRRTVDAIKPCNVCISVKSCARLELGGHIPMR